MAKTAQARSISAEPVEPALIEAAAAWSSAPVLTRRQHGRVGIEVRLSGRDLWVLLRRDAAGGLALRTHLFVEGARVAIKEGQRDVLALEIDNPLGRFAVRLWGEPSGLEQFRYTVELTPAQMVRLTDFPRDLIIFGANGDPLAATGKIEARQRKCNTGLIYLDIDEPQFGKVLYVQNLTALNDYFHATGSTPENVVGGEWPLVGYRPPTQPNAPDQCLRAGKPIRLYDTHLVLRTHGEHGEADSAWQFLDMLCAVYRHLEKPRTRRRDWLARSNMTLRDLQSSAKVRERHFGNVYFHPYTSAEHPDVMVQLSLMSAVEDWSRWNGRRHPLLREIRKGLSRFHDRKLKTLRRYLPDVGDDKNADAVDSWYLYHPLLNLSNLALAGDATARQLFLDSVEYGIRAARHFKYRWPIQYDVRTFRVIEAVADADGRGQTDVGGIYAWVMLQAFELTGEQKFLDEAATALDAARGMRFDLNYQANLTAWGAAACIRLWRITNRKTYLALSYVYLASFFHNAQIWESAIGNARHYSNFMGVTCLQDAPYMAMYECFDSFAAFERYLDLGGPDLIPSAQLLVSEYCRYALHRAWWYYPDALPAESLAEKQRNGEIDPALSFPVEDLYPDGQPAGQVGQEIYGGGAAMVFATRSYHRIGGAPFHLYCDHFLRSFSRIEDRMISFNVAGPEGFEAELALVANGRRRLPPVIVRTLSGRIVEPVTTSRDEVLYAIPANGGILLSWS